jgi:small ligand-binding sensory domain FIST
MRKQSVMVPPSVVLFLAGVCHVEYYMYGGRVETFVGLLIFATLPPLHKNLRTDSVCLGVTIGKLCTICLICKCVTVLRQLWGIFPSGGRVGLGRVVLVGQKVCVK